MFVCKRVLFVRVQYFVLGGVDEEIEVLPQFRQIETCGGDRSARVSAAAALGHVSDGLVAVHDALLLASHVDNLHLVGEQQRLACHAAARVAVEHVLDASQFARLASGELDQLLGRAMLVLHLFAAFAFLTFTK